jgi:hypothetical protein
MLTGLLTLPRALRRRREVQAMHTVSLDYVEAILTPLTEDDA